MIRSLSVSLALAIVLPLGCGRAERAGRILTSSRATPIPTPDVKKFDAVYRAFKEIEGATAVGVTQMQFGPLLQRTATEMSILTDRLKTDPERDLAKRYAEALNDYQDSAYLCQKSSEYPRAFENEAVFTIGKTTDPQLERMVKKYGLKPVAHRMK